MRKLLLCLVCLTLSACISVDDFSDYWSKGYIDKAVVGAWDEVHEGKIDRTRYWAFRDQNDGEYHFWGHDLRGSKEGFQGKSLNVGDYKFMMVAMDWRKKRPNGLFIRYEVLGDEIFIYALDPKKVDQLIASQHLDTNNIHLVWKPRDHLGTRVDLNKLDTAVVKFLAGIPDQAEYWRREVVFRRHPTFKFNE